MIKDFDAAYIDASLARDFPAVSQETFATPKQAQDTSQMPLGTGPDDIQLASAADPRGTISATPRNPIMGGVADFVRGVRNLANQYEIKEFVPLLGGMGVGDLLVGKSPEELEEWAYGNSPITMPPSGTGGYIPFVKTGRKEQLLDTMFLGMDAVGLGKSAGVAGRAAVKKLGPKAADMLATTVKNQGFPIEGLSIVEPGPGVPKIDGGSGAATGTASSKAKAKTRITGSGKAPPPGAK